MNDTRNIATYLLGAWAVFGMTYTRNIATYLLGARAIILL
jgi:hypothetical protein